MSSPSSDRLSILIVSYNTADLLRRCLQSLHVHPPSVPWEVIVIDNASQDGSADMVEREFPTCHLIRSEVNEGYGVAINQGVRLAGGSHLMFLNPDMECSAGALETLLRFAASHPQAGVISPRLLLSNGEPQPSARRWVSAWGLLLEASRLHLLLPKRLRGRLMLGTYYGQTDTSRVPWVSGACHFIPRNVWEKVGPLTEETFCGFDDYDYCYRAWKAGFEVWLCAEAEMTHHCSVSVKHRWNSWEVEQVATHNTYVVLSSHWPTWRIKLFGLAELAAHGSEWIRDTFKPRPRADVGDDYRERLRKRIRLSWNLFTGRQQPIRRFQPTGRTVPAAENASAEQLVSSASSAAS